MSILNGWPPEAEAWRKSAGLSWAGVAAAAGVRPANLLRWRQPDGGGVVAMMRLEHALRLEAAAPGFLDAMVAARRRPARTG